MFRKLRYRRNSSDRRGVTAVEFGVTAPVLFLLVFSICEFARFNMIRHGADSAAYEGARRGMVPGATADDVYTSANAILQAVSAVGATVDVQPGVLTPQTPEVTVTVQIPIASNGWVVHRFFPHSTLTRSCTLARERTESE